MPSALVTRNPANTCGVFLRRTSVAIVPAAGQADPGLQPACTGRRTHQPIARSKTGGRLADAYHRLTGPGEHDRAAAGDVKRIVRGEDPVEEYLRRAKEHERKAAERQAELAKVEKVIGSGASCLSNQSMAIGANRVLSETYCAWLLPSESTCRLRPIPRASTPGRSPLPLPPC